MGIGFPENCTSGMVTDATIISEICRWKEEFKDWWVDKLRGGWLRSEDAILSFLSC
jgi:hypothetical protein